MIARWRGRDEHNVAGPASRGNDRVRSLRDDSARHLTKPNAIAITLTPAFHDYPIAILQKGALRRY